MLPPQLPLGALLPPLACRPSPAACRCPFHSPCPDDLPAAVQAKGQTNALVCTTKNGSGVGFLTATCFPVPSDLPSGAAPFETV